MDIQHAGGSPDDLQKFDISTGTLSFQYDSPYHGDHPICGDVWFSVDGSRVFNSCATAFHVSAAKDQDLQYFGGMNRSIQIVSLDHSAALDKVIAISKPYDYYYSGPLKVTDSEIQVYDYEYLSYAGRIPLPQFTAGSKTFAAHGKFVTYSADSSKVYVVAQADATSGLNNDFGLSVIQWQSPGNCGPSLGASSSSMTSNAAAATVEVTAPDNCLWEAAGNPSWISFPDGRYGIGATAFAYRITENLASAARTAAITIGGVGFNLNQAAAAASADPLSRLPFSPIAADYSQTLDSIIAVSAAPGELHIFNPQTKSDKVVRLVLPPTSVAVSPSGQMAAVGHDGWVSYVNLVAGTVQRLYKVPTVAGSLIVGGYGYLHVFPKRDQWESIHSIEIASGATSTYASIYAGIMAALHPSGKYFYTSDSWMEKYGISEGKPKVLKMNTNASGCGRVWFFSDGGRLLTGCGIVLRSSEIEQQDMAYAGTLSEGTGVAAASHSGPRKLLAVVHGSPYYPSSGTNSKIDYYNDDFLGYQGNDTIPTFANGGKTYTANGRWLFWSADSSKLFVIVQADPAANLVADSAVFTITPSTSIPTCSYTASSSVASFAAAAGTGSIAVTAGSACSWQAASTVDWIAVTGGSPGSGTGQVAFAIAANLSTTQRTGSILVGGQTVTITQAGTLSTIGAVGLGGLSPLTGSTPSNTFTATFTHGGGASQHYLGYILLLPTPNIVWFTAKGSCLIEYNRISNGVRLINDLGNNWLGPVSGVRIGPNAGSLSNSLCSVDVSKTVAWVDGNNMVVRVPVILKSSLTPVLGTFLQALDVNGKWTDMRQFGNWVLSPATSKPGPSIGGVSPAYNFGTSATYSMQIRHSVDVSRIGEVHIRFDTQIVGGTPCHIIYFPLSNTLNLINDAGTALVSATSSTLGSAGPLSNSYCTIDPADAAKSTGGGALTVNVPVTFNKQTFGGMKNVYVNAFDTTGALTHWVQAGTTYVQ